MAIRSPAESNPRFIVSLTLVFGKQDDSEKPAITKKGIRSIVEEVTVEITRKYAGDVAARMSEHHIVCSYDIRDDGDYWILDVSYHCPRGEQPDELEDSLVKLWLDRNPYYEMISNIKDTEI